MKLSISQIKYVKSLHARKSRQKYHNFVVEGEKMCGEVLRQGDLEIELIATTQEWADANRSLLKVHERRLHIVSTKELKRVSLLATPNQVLLVACQPEHQFPGHIRDLTLYLDGLQDPGNLGTILRVADWFGIEWVFYSPDTVEVFNPKVVQASMGAFLRVKCMAAEFGDLKEAFPGIPIYGAVLDGDNVFKMFLPPAAILVIGNESRGISPMLQQQLTHRAAIPRHAIGGAESLNAAVAAGILCATFRNYRVSGL
ncbi:MAG: RNA methyltransferase [Saprospiraceae bacterium]|nr:MAG: RNA methyltransferase [Saprospiraceae bacterium]